MNLYELTKVIYDVCKQDERVRSVYQKDVYTIWNETETKYSSVVFNYVNCTENIDYVDFNFVFYYGDLLNEKQNNELPIHSIATSVISNIMHKIDSLEHIDVVLPYTIDYFTQKFQDVIAGCYANVSFRVMNDWICD